MSRRRKIFTAGFILVLGVALAWPFRRTAVNLDEKLSPGESQNNHAIESDDLVALTSGPPRTSIPIAPDQVSARAASTAEQTNPAGRSPLESFDLANHPVVVDSEKGVAEAIGSPPQSLNDEAHKFQPVFSMTGAPPVGREPQWPAELIHIVANGDTLEKLAERYLNDAGAALEIFDLNRDQLTNPHLLPIGVELRIPVHPGRIID